MFKNIGLGREICTCYHCRNYVCG